MQSIFLENETENPFSRSKAPTEDFHVEFDKKHTCKLKYNINNLKIKPFFSIQLLFLLIYYIFIISLGGLCMRVVVQRVKHASVTIDGKVNGRINNGFLVLLGIKSTDSKQDVDYLVKKVTNLRIFTDENDKMNLSLKDINGELLIISQFTLYGDCKDGNRPSFIEAAKPDVAIPLYEYFIAECKKQIPVVETGIFGADMKVELLNDGPVTIIIDSEDKKRK